MKRNGKCRADFVRFAMESANKAQERRSFFCVSSEEFERWREKRSHKILKLYGANRTRFKLVEQFDSALVDWGEMSFHQSGE